MLMQTYVAVPAEPGSLQLMIAGLIVIGLYLVITGKWRQLRTKACAATTIKQHVHQQDGLPAANIDGRAVRDFDLPNVSPLTRSDLVAELADAADLPHGEPEYQGANGIQCDLVDLLQLSMERDCKRVKTQPYCPAGATDEGAQESS